MSHLGWVLAAIFAVGVVLGLLAWLLPKRGSPVASESAPAERAGPWHATTGWTSQAGEEFAELNEAARCDLIFAVSDLRDERSQQMLEHALDDPSDAVALAAAHSLAARGEAAVVETYAKKHPGDRAQRILQTLAMLR